MKRTLLTLALIGIILTSGLLGGCITIGGGGTPTTKTYDYANFTKIQIGNAFKFQITQGQAFSVSVNATDKVLNRVAISQSGDTLKIELTGWFIGFNNNATVAITMPDLRGVDVSGACRGTANGFQSGNDLNVKLSGASQLTTDMKTGGFTADVSGASTLKGSLNSTGTNIKLTGASQAELTGSGGALTLNASGASRALLSGFQVTDASIDLSGASHGEVNASGKLDVTASGASSLDYSGNPTLGTVNISGASSINKK